MLLLAILQKLFSMYSSIMKNNLNSIDFRQFSKFYKDFAINSKVDTLKFSEINLIFTRRTKTKYANFFEFIEILYQIYKCNKNNQEKNEKDLKFRKYLDSFIITPFKKLIIKYSCYCIDKIQIFYQNYNNYENPSLIILIQYDDLLKHVKKLIIK